MYVPSLGEERYGVYTQIVQMVPIKRARERRERNRKGDIGKSLKASNTSGSFMKKNQDEEKIDSGHQIYPKKEPRSASAYN